MSKRNVVNQWVNIVCGWNKTVDNNKKVYLVFFKTETIYNKQ